MRLVAANDKETVAGAEWISIYDHRLGQVSFRKSDNKLCAGLPDHMGENFDRLICYFWFMDAKVIATNAFLPVKACITFRLLTGLSNLGQVQKRVV